jgi:uncharacterized protein YeaO (DUF488 family)
MPVRGKRWNDPPAPDDGFRLLICRIRPRGVSKAKETWDDWWPDLGPSRALLDAFHGKSAPAVRHGNPRRVPKPSREGLRQAKPGSVHAIPWSEYRARYLDEMAGPAQTWRIRDLARRAAAGETITLLCSSACTDPAHCHRTLLARLISARP